MATPAGVLSYVVEVDTTRGTAALRKWDSTVSRAGTTSSRATKSTSALSKATGGLGRSLGRAAVAGASAAAAYLSIAQAKAAIAATQDLAKVTIGLSRNLGLAEKSASQWGAVAKSRDIDTKSLNMSFTTLSRNLTDLRQGSTTAAQSFENLGLNQQKLKGMNFDQALMTVADAFGEAKGGAERQATAQKLLGRGYQTILPLFAEGSKGLKEQKRWADEFGATLSGKTLKGQMDLIEAQRKSKVAWLGLQVTFTKALTPALEKAHKVFQRISRIMASDKLTRKEKFEKVSKIIGKWADKALDAFIKVLPKIVSAAADRGPKIARALWKGFKNASFWGKAVIAGFIVGKLALGFAPLLGASGKASKWGTRAGNAFGKAFAAGAVLFMWDMLPKKFQGTGGKLSGEPGATTQFPSQSGIGRLERMGLRGLLPWEEGKRGGVATPGGFLSFQRGGVVPGSGMGDKVPAMLEPGEIVWPNRKGDRKRAAGKMGKGLGLAQRLAAEAKLTKNPAAELGKRFEGIRDRGAAATDKLEEKVGRNFKGMSKDSQKKTEDTRKKVTDRFGRMNRDSSKQADRMKTSVSSSFRSLATNVTKGIGIIGTQTNKALKALGVKTLNFGVSTGGGNDAEGRARGGMIGGKGRRDNVPIMAAPGEAFLTRHQQVPVENALRTVYGKGLDDLFRGNSKPHYMAKGGRAGLTKPFDVMGSGPGFVPMMNFLNANTGQGMLKVISGLRHNSTVAGSGAVSNHATGDAVDISTQGIRFLSMVSNQLGQAPAREVKAMDATNAYLERHFAPPVGLDQLWRTADGGGHWNHIHKGINPKYGQNVQAMLQYLSKLPGASGLAALKKVTLTGPKGPLRDMGQAALDKVFKAANEYIASRQNFGTGAGGITAGAGSDIEIFKEICKQKGWNFNDWWALDAAETSHGKNLTNPTSTARLRGQFLDMNWGKYGPGSDPRQNPSMRQQIISMGRYIQERYQNPTRAWAFHRANNYYGKGGVVGEPLPTLDRGGRVETAGVAQVHPGDVHRGKGSPDISMHFHGDRKAMSALATLDEVYAIVDGERVEVERHGRQRARMRGPA